MIYVELDHSKIPKELFKQYPLLRAMLSLIKVAHNGQTYNNLPYWHHPVRVMLRLNWTHVIPSDIYAALGHDLLEDTPVTAGDLKNFGFDDRTIHLIQGVTRNKDEDTYKLFIQKIVETKDEGLMRLKLADLYENSNNVRFLPPEKRNIMVRYGKSITDILNALTAMQSGDIADMTLSGELNRSDVEKWIGEQPSFV